MKKALLRSVVVFCAVTRPVVGQHTDHRALAGLKGIVAYAGVLGDADAIGLTRDELSAVAVGELRRAGVPVYPITDTVHDQAALPVLIQLRCDDEHCMYTVTAELREDVMLTRPPEIKVYAVTWEHLPYGITVVTRKNLQPSVLDDVRNIMNRFAKAYLAANPKH
jgi:hypothetical protein